ncbi:hypothetical protein T4C_8391 [Trichinella pseudospiralis]|uniref:Uncharacterized protein n=1 Tax=Trichinella pseudospiralis TaxID=6337 RepID=A0A0V1K0C3_TRIPS|nr:hypothetical protein T4C_8391 [Trichinella pseudospiralis]
MQRSNVKKRKSAHILKLINDYDALSIPKCLDNRLKQLQTAMLMHIQMTIFIIKEFGLDKILSIMGCCHSNNFWAVTSNEDDPLLALSRMYLPGRHLQWDFGSR